MKQYSTQYTTNCFDTFIEMAEDCPAAAAQTPPVKESVSAPQVEYEILIGGPWQCAPDDGPCESGGGCRETGRGDFSPKDELGFSAPAAACGRGVRGGEEGKTEIYTVESVAPDGYQKLGGGDTPEAPKAARSSEE